MTSNTVILSPPSISVGGLAASPRVLASFEVEYIIHDITRNVKRFYMIFRDIFVEGQKLYFVPLVFCNGMRDEQTAYNDCQCS